MASTIVTKNSSTASAVPLTGDLTQGELAVNVTDKRLFTKNSGGTVVELGTNPASLALPNGTANGVAYLNGSKVVTSGSALTFDGTNFVVGASAAFTVGTGTLVQSQAVGASGYVAARYSANASEAVVNFGKSRSGVNATLGVAVASGDRLGGLQFYGDDGTSWIQGAKFWAEVNGTVSTGSVPSNFVWSLSGSEQMRLTSTGLGIGTSSPAAKLHSSKADGGYVFAVSGTTKGMRVSTDANQTLLQGVDNTLTGSYQPLTLGGSILLFQTNGTTEAMRLDTSGNLGLGVTPSAWGSTFKALQLANGVSYASSSDPSLQITQNGYYDGTNWKFIANGYATNYQHNTGQHIWRVSSASGTAGTSITFTQAMTLDASGNLLVGTTSARDTGGTRSIAINGVGLAASLDLTCTSTGGRSYAIYTSGSSNNGIQFYDLTASAERARIDSSGNLLVGKTTTGNTTTGWNIGVAGTGNQVFNITSSNEAMTYNNNNSTGATYLIDFRQNNSQKGYIAVSSTAVTYSTSSDYRLKNSVAPMTGALAKIASLKPVTYKWNSDDSHGEGFIAHELAEVCPQAVTGEKDAVDADGNPKYQGIDTSFLVATLTAAIKEQQTLIQQLQADVAALKGK